MNRFDTPEQIKAEILRLEETYHLAIQSGGDTHGGTATMFSPARLETMIRALYLRYESLTGETLLDERPTYIDMRSRRD